LTGKREREKERERARERPSILSTTLMVDIDDIDDIDGRY